MINYIKNEWDFYLPLFVFCGMFSIAHSLPMGSFWASLLTAPMGILASFYVQDWRRNKR